MTEERNLAKKGDGLLIPMVSVAEMKAVMDYIQELKEVIMVKDIDYVIQKGKQYTVRSGFEKLAQGFVLSDEILHEDVIEDSDGKFLGWRFTVRVWQPATGRTAEGVGACTIDEDNIQKKEESTPGRAFHHDTYATANTRAFNRGVARIVGSVGVSGEEMRLRYEQRDRKKADSKQSLKLPESFEEPAWNFTSTLEASGWDSVESLIRKWVNDTGLVFQNTFHAPESDGVRAWIKPSAWLGDSFGAVASMLDKAGFKWRSEDKGFIYMKPLD